MTHDTSEEDPIRIKEFPQSSEADVTVTRLETAKESKHHLNALEEYFDNSDSVGGIIHVCTGKNCDPKTWHFVSFTRNDNGQLTIYDTADGSKATGKDAIHKTFSKYIIVHLYAVYVNR